LSSRPPILLLKHSWALYVASLRPRRVPAEQLF
jgi:hypothetical protein